MRCWDLSTRYDVFRVCLLQRRMCHVFGVCPCSCSPSCPVYHLFHHLLWETLQDLVRPLLDGFGLDVNKIFLFGSCFTLELVLEVMCAYWRGKMLIVAGLKILVMVALFVWTLWSGTGRVHAWEWHFYANTEIQKYTNANIDTQKFRAYWEGTFT